MTVHRVFGSGVGPLSKTQAACWGERPRIAKKLANRQEALASPPIGDHVSRVPTASRTRFLSLGDNDDPLGRHKPRSNKSC